MRIKYLGRDREGNPVSGEIEVENLNEARDILQSRGIYIIDIKELKKKEFVIQKLKSQELIFFSRQLSLLLRSGVTIIQALEIIQENVKNKNFRNVIQKLREHILGGESFSESLRNFKGVFPEIFIEVVRVGEFTGNIDEVLSRISDFLEKEDELRRKVKNALIYPEIVIGTVVVAVVFILLTIVPIFVNLFQSSGVKLPLPTRILLGISNGIKNYWWIILPAIILIIFLFNLYRRTKNGKKTIDKILFNLPTIIGKIYRENIFLRISHTLETLIRSGINLGDSFQLLSRISGNEVISESLINAREKIMSGMSISRALLNEKVFPLLFVRMISVGEAGGNLEEVLKQMERYFESELDNDIKRFIAYLEPTLTIILGILVAFIAFSIYLPLFDMVRLIKSQGLK